MADFLSSLGNIPFISSASPSAAAVAAKDDDFEDSCSICLEPFNSEGPPTVTNCRHEYHLHCILEWSQRRKECPICWQLLVLKDHASQELLATVENERNLRSRGNARNVCEDYLCSHDISYSYESDLEERIMRDFVAAAHRARYVGRRGRHKSSGIAPSQVLLSVTTGDLPLSDVQHSPTTSPDESQSLAHELIEGDSSTSSTQTTIHSQTPSFVVRDLNTEPKSVRNRNGGIKPSQLQPESLQRPSSSEVLAISESIKSKFSAASSRYKESISKFTRVVKEKQRARNMTVKDLGRGVQREMHASIAGVARIIERLDLTTKHTGVSVPLSSCQGETSNLASKGKHLQEDEITESPNENDGGNGHGPSSDASACVKSTFPRQLEASLVQDLDSGKMTDNADECSGLYILKELKYPQEQPETTVSE